MKNNKGINWEDNFSATIYVVLIIVIIILSIINLWYLCLIAAICIVSFGGLCLLDFLQHRNNRLKNKLK